MCVGASQSGHLACVARLGILALGSVPEYKVSLGKEVWESTALLQLRLQRET